MPCRFRRQRGFSCAVFSGKRVLSLLFSLIILATISMGHLWAATIRVPSDYKTIQESINKASPGDTIAVSEGTYNENVSITKPLILKSENGPGVTIIRAKAGQEPVIKIMNADGVSITGFTVAGSTAAGILVHSSSNSRITENKIVNNGYGIFISSSQNNIVTSNTTSKNDLYGIYLETSTGNVIEGNTSVANADKGIFLNASSANKITGNEVGLNEWDGITLWASNNNLLQDNEVFRNRYSIVIAGSENNSEVNNTTYPNLYIILPIVLVYLSFVLFYIEKKIFAFLERQ